MKLTTEEKAKPKSARSSVVKRLLSILAMWYTLPTAPPGSSIDSM